MHLIFFDEVKPQPDYPYYHIGAICVEEDNLKNIEQDINNIAFEVFKDFQLKPTTELHAKDIYHRKKAFKHISDGKFRVEIIVKLLAILAKPEVQLINIQINTGNLYNSSNAADLAFMFLCEKANSLMRAEKSLGMLVGDHESDTYAERFSVDLSHYRAKGTDYLLGKEITNLFESVHFTHSHLSRFLQLADIYSWILQFKNRHRKKPETKHLILLDLIKEKEIRLFPSKYKEWPNK